MTTYRACHRKSFFYAFGSVLTPGAPDVDFTARSFYCRLKESGGWGPRNAQKVFACRMPVPFKGAFLESSFITPRPARRSCRF